MTYTRYYTTWQNWPNTSTPITAAAMQHIETGIVNAGTGGSQAAEWVTVPVSSAEILDWTNNAVELLVAPGGRNYYVVLALVLHYRFVTTPYSENVQNDLMIGFGSDLATIGGAGLAFIPLATVPTQGNLFKKTEDWYATSPSTTTGASVGTYNQSAAVLENAALKIGIPFGAPLTGGDGTLSVRILRSIIDGAP